MESEILEPGRSDVAERSAEGPLGVSTRAWLAGTVAGLVGGLAMGLVAPAGTMAAIGSLYGQSTVLAGWVAHLAHSVVFALAFVLVVRRTRLRQYTRTATGVTALGVAYGALLAVTTGAFVMPLWLNAVAAAGAPVPNLTTNGIVGHLVYGLLLGGTYALGGGVDSAASERARQPSGASTTVEVESPRVDRPDRTGRPERTDGEEAEPTAPTETNGDRPRPPRID